MSSLGAAIDRLRTYGRLLAHTAPHPDVDADAALKPLLGLVENLEQRATGRRAVNAKGDVIVAARREWSSMSPLISQLSRRTLRILCSDAASLDDPVFLTALSTSNALKVNPRLAERMLLAYDASWTEARAAVWGPAVRVAFDGHPRPSAKARVFLTKQDFLTASAAKAIASSAVQLLKTPETLASEYHLQRDGALIDSAKRHLFGAWESVIKAAKSGRLLEALEFGMLHFALPRVVDHEQRSEAVTLMILAVAKADAGLVEWLREKLLGASHFGDPRKPANRNNWSLVSRDARQRFVQWLAREDLRFFFEAVMHRTPDPHGRREFWDEWLDNDRLVESAVALSESDQRYLRSRGLLKPGLTFSRLSGGNDVSAFLLRFRTSTRDIVAIEFSQVNNAAYFHDGEAFDRSGQGLDRSYYSIDTLKQKYTKLSPPPGMGPNWTHHHSGWQYTFRRALSFYLR